MDHLFDNNSEYVDCVNVILIMLITVWGVFLISRSDKKTTTTTTTTTTAKPSGERKAEE